MASFIPDYSKQQSTDHNPSDPGVTLLDNLRYALSDLGYRVAFTVPELLAPEGPALGESLLSPARALSAAPLTYADYRKGLLNQPGLRNVGLSRVTASGLFYATDRKRLTYRRRNPTVDTTQAPNPAWRAENDLPDRLFQPLELKGIHQVTWLAEGGASARLAEAI